MSAVFLFNITSPRKRKKLKINHIVMNRNWLFRLQTNQQSSSSERVSVSVQKSAKAKRFLFWYCNNPHFFKTLSSVFTSSEWLNSSESNMELKFLKTKIIIKIKLRQFPAKKSGFSRQHVTVRIPKSAALTRSVRKSTFKCLIFNPGWLSEN